MCALVCHAYAHAYLYVLCMFLLCACECFYSVVADGVVEYGIVRCGVCA